MEEKFKGLFAHCHVYSPDQTQTACSLIWNSDHRVQRGCTVLNCTVFAAEFKRRDKNAQYAKSTPKVYDAGDINYVNSSREACENFCLLASGPLANIKMYKWHGILDTSEIT